MSNQKLLMIAHTLILSTHRVFVLSNFFHHALEVSFPHILSDFMLKKTITGYLIFFPYDPSQDVTPHNILF